MYCCIKLLHINWCCQHKPLKRIILVFCTWPVPWILKELLVDNSISSVEEFCTPGSKTNTQFGFGLILKQRKSHQVFFQWEKKKKKSGGIMLKHSKVLLLADVILACWVLQKASVIQKKTILLEDVRTRACSTIFPSSCKWAFQHLMLRTR